MMSSQFTIVGIGEALFDLVAGQQILGGAPLNVAVHAHQIAGLRDGRGVIVSRVGQDPLGQRAHQLLSERGIDTSYLQDDPDRETGKVYVEFDDADQPTYDIAEHVAWDRLQYDGNLEYLARGCDAVCFGTLAQRDAESRSAIHRFLNDARRAVRLFDVNLRQKYYDARIVQRSCDAATAVKLNEHELPIIARLTGIAPPADLAGDDLNDALATALRKKFNLKQVILTHGERGTVLYTTAARVRGEPVSIEEVTRLIGGEAAASPAGDAVGAGDACAAAVLVGLVLRLGPARIVDLANLLGAYVASQPGATPEFPEPLLQRVRELLGG